MRVRKIGILFVVVVVVLPLLCFFLGHLGITFVKRTCLLCSQLLLLKLICFLLYDLDFKVRCKYLQCPSWNTFTSSLLNNDSELSCLAARLLY